MGPRRVDPYHLLFQGGQFYLLGYAHERKAIRVFRLSRIRGKVSYATKAEHDFHRPADFDPRAYANRADWQLGEERGVAEILISERIAWQIERHFGRYGEILPARASERDAGGRSRLPHRLRERAQAHLVGARPRRARAPARPRGAGRASCSGAWSCWRSATARPAADAERSRHGAGSSRAPTARRITTPRARAPLAGRRRRATEERRRRARAEAAIRPERFARLVTLASILIQAGRAGRARVPIDEVCERLQTQRGGAARGRERPQRRQLRRRLLRALRRDQRGGRARSRSTRSPTATTSTGRRGCCRSRRRRWSRRST